jgi:folate-binding protein YgfZ
MKNTGDPGMTPADDRAGTTPASGPGEAGVEYRAGRNKVALFDLSGRGRLRLAGADALDVLHRTTTADLKGLLAGQGAMTVIQTETARVLDWLTLWVREVDLIVVTGEDRAAADRAWIDGVVIMDDVTVEDVTAETRLFEMIGPLAPDAARTLGGPEAAGLEPHHHRPFDWEGISGMIARGRPAPLPSFRLLVAAADGDRFARRLVESGTATRAGDPAYEALRIEQGAPLPGRELTPETNPLEAGLLDSIGLRKGCYTGQEVIARMITYKSQKRVLTGIVLDGAASPPPFRGSWPVRAAEEATGAAAPAGRVTSVAYCYGIGATAGLAIVPIELARPGTRLIVETGAGEITARAAALPLLP